MELHISSNDFDYITDIFEIAHENLNYMKGYCSIKGTDKKGENHFSVFVNGKEFSDKMKRPVSFGEMLDIMKHAGPNTMFFQREDWQGTPQAVFFDDRLGNQIISKGIMQPVPGGDYVDYDTGLYQQEIPYIPNYEDFFSWGWCIYKIKNNVVEEPDDDFDEDDDDMVDYGGYSF